MIKSTYILLSSQTIPLGMLTVVICICTCLSRINSEFDRTPKPLHSFTDILFTRIQNLNLIIYFFIFGFECFIQVDDECSSDADCGPGLYCFSCTLSFQGHKCVRSTGTNPFNLVVSL